MPSTKQRKQASREEARGVKDLVIDCLKNTKRGHQEGDGMKKTTLRIIELSPALWSGGNTCGRFRLGSVKVEEYEVWRADSKDDSGRDLG